MARKKDLCRDKRGMFVRNLGWKLTGEKYAQQKFYLGSDEAKAQIASLKLEQLWNAFSARWEASTLPIARLKPDSESQSVVADTPTPQNPLGTGATVVLTVGVGDWSMSEKEDQSGMKSRWRSPRQFAAASQ